MHEHQTDKPAATVAGDIADLEGLGDLDVLEASRWGTVHMGGGTCETCGPHHDHLAWELEAAAAPESGSTWQITVQTSFGCYHGDTLTTGDVNEAAAFFTALRSRLPEYYAELSVELGRLRDAVRNAAHGADSASVLPPAAAAASACA